MSRDLKRAGEMRSNKFNRKMSYDDDIRSIRDQLADWTEAERGSGPANPDRATRARQSEWLKIIYETKRLSLQKELDRAWNMQQFMWPLSLAPLLALAAADAVRVGQVVVLAIASCFLLLMSNVYVDRLIWMQYKADAWLEAIEAEIGLEEMRRVPKLDLPRWKPRRYGFSFYRHAMLVALVVVWGILIVGADRGWI